MGGSRKTCSIEGCERPFLARGFCKFHYERARARGGRGRAGQLPNGTCHAFLVANVNFSDDGCLMWPYGRGPNGRYGATRFEGKSQGAHRVMCILAHGVPPFEGAEAAHSCGNGFAGCVNPRHLRWATRRENEDDKIIHGTIARGEQHYNAKLSTDHVLAIYADTRGCTAIGVEYGVHDSAIYNIRHGISWAWLTGHKRKAA